MSKGESFAIRNISKLAVCLLCFVLLASNFSLLQLHFGSFLFVPSIMGTGNRFSLSSLQQPVAYREVVANILSLLFKLTRPLSFTFLVFQSLLRIYCTRTHHSTRSNPIAIYMAYTQAVELYAMIYRAGGDTESWLVRLFFSRCYEGQFDIILFPQIQTHSRAFFSSYSMCTHPSMYFLMSSY